VAFGEFINSCHQFPLIVDIVDQGQAFITSRKHHNFMSCPSASAFTWNQNSPEVQSVINWEGDPYKELSINVFAVIFNICNELIPF